MLPHFEAVEASNAKLVKENAALRERIRLLEIDRQKWREQPIARATPMRRGEFAAARPGLPTSAMAAAPSPTVTKAPVYAPIPYNWTGLYVGITGGGGWGRTKQFDIIGATLNPYNQSGGTFGGTTGIQIQYNRWVLGFEGDWSWANITGTVSSPLCLSNNCFTTLQSFGTARPRIGYAWDRWMIYATGGVAYGSIKAGQASCPTASGNFGFCGTNNEVGWTAGGGIEAFVVSNWSVKLEYLHIDLGTHYTYTVAAQAAPLFVQERVDVIRAGLNYHFDWGGPVVAKY